MPPDTERHEEAVEAAYTAVDRSWAGLSIVGSGSRHRAVDAAIAAYNTTLGVEPDGDLVERAVQNISDEDKRIGLVGYRLTDEQVRKIVRVVLTAATLGAEGERGDGPCADCGGSNLLGGTYWFADNALWNAVVPEGGVLCAPCFTRRCEAQGVGIGWRAGRVGEIEVLAAPSLDRTTEAAVHAGVLDPSELEVGPDPETGEREADDEVRRFYAAAALPIGTPVQDSDGRRGTLVKRGGQRWVSRDKLPLVRWHGYIDAEPVPWQVLLPTEPLQDGGREREWHLFCPSCEQTSVDTGDGSCETCGAQTLSVVPAKAKTQPLQPAHGADCAYCMSAPDDAVPLDPDGDWRDPRALLRRVLGYYPEPPSRGLMADVEACLAQHPHQDVERAEQRIQELIAAVERGMADHMRLAGEHASTLTRAEAAEQEVERLREAIATHRRETEATTGMGSEPSFEGIDAKLWGLTPNEGGTGPLPLIETMARLLAPIRKLTAAERDPVEETARGLTEGLDDRDRSLVRAALWTGWFLGRDVSDEGGTDGISK